MKCVLKFNYVQDCYISSHAPEIFIFYMYAHIYDAYFVSMFTFALARNSAKICAEVLTNANNKN